VFPLQGACVNLGCVPKKVMYYGAQVMNALHDAGGYGIKARVEGVDWADLRARREAYIARCNDKYAEALARARIDLVTGAAAFEDARTVTVAGAGAEPATRLTAPHIVVATGGAPVVPQFPGSGLGIDSDGFFALDALPKKAAVVGGGYIAVELAGILQAYGTEVHLVLRTAEILRSFDVDIRTQLLADIAAGPRGMTVHVDSNLAALAQTPAEAAAGTRTLTLAQPGGRATQLAGLDTVLYAIGRSPLTRALNLGAAGVAVDRGGYIPVDERQMSNVSGIYAVGDVCGKIQLTPSACLFFVCCGDSFLFIYPARLLMVRSPFLHACSGDCGRAQAGAPAL
jgi:glutathione reductase (NADPH)